MSRPKFLFLADSSEPDAPCGMATWKLCCTDGDKVTKMYFQSFIDARAIDSMIQASYEQGKRDGVERMCVAIEEAIKTESER